MPDRGGKGDAGQATVAPRCRKRSEHEPCSVRLDDNGVAAASEGPMQVDDLDIPVGKLTESAQRVVDRAIEDARRRAHPLLTSAHMCLALAQVQWDLFARAMREAGVNANHVVRAIDEHLQRASAVPGCDTRVAPTTKLVCRLA